MALITVIFFSFGHVFCTESLFRRIGGAEKTVDLLHHSRDLKGSKLSLAKRDFR